MQPRRISRDQFIQECAEWARDMKRQRRRYFRHPGLPPHFSLA
jgi:hypothetical protein